MREKMRERELIDDVRAEEEFAPPKGAYMGLNPLDEPDLSDRSEVLRRGERSLTTLTLFIMSLGSLFTLWLVLDSPRRDPLHVMSGEVVEPLTLWHSEEGEDEERLVRLVQRYATETHRAVRLQFFTPQELSAKLLASEPSTRPDLWISTHERLGAWVERDLVTPLGLKVSKPLEMVERNKALFTPLTYQGELYGLPLSYESLTLFYQHALMGSMSGIYDFQSLFRKLREVGRSYPQLEGLLGVADMSDPLFHAPWLHGFGGDAYALSHDEEAQEALLRSVARVKAMRAYKMMTPALSGERAVQLFLEGKLLALIHRASFVKSLKGNEYVWRGRGLPRMREGANSPYHSRYRHMSAYLIVKGVMISKHSPHVEAAWRLAYLLNAENDTLFWWHKQLNSWSYQGAKVSNDPQDAHVLDALGGFLKATLEADEPPREALSRLLKDLSAPQRFSHSASLPITSPSLIHKEP